MIPALSNPQESSAEQSTDEESPADGTNLTVGERHGATRATDYARFVAGAESRRHHGGGSAMDADRADMLACGGDFYSDLLEHNEDDRVKKKVCFDDSIALALFKKNITLKAAILDVMHVLRGICKEVPFRATYVRRYLPHCGSEAEEANSLHSDVLDEFGLGVDHVRNLELLHELYLEDDRVYAVTK